MAFCSLGEDCLLFPFDLLTWQIALIDFYRSLHYSSGHRPCFMIPDTWALPHVVGTTHLTCVGKRQSLSRYRSEMPGFVFLAACHLSGHETRFDRANVPVRGFCSERRIQNANVALYALVVAPWTVGTVTVLSLSPWIYDFCWYACFLGLVTRLPNSWWVTEYYFSLYMFLLKCIRTRICCLWLQTMVNLHVLVR